MFGTLYHTHSSLLLIFKCSGKRDSIQVSLTTRQVINTWFISVTAGGLGVGAGLGCRPEEDFLKLVGGFQGWNLGWQSRTGNWPCC